MSELYRLRAAGCLLALCLAQAAFAQSRSDARGGDYIAAIVNQELVTAGEIQARVVRAREEAGRAGQRLPPEPQLRQQILEVLIEERVLVTHARDSGQRVDEAELDRAVANVAVQNQLSLPQLRERLRKEGIDYTRFRNTIRDQLLVERIREREVQARTRVTDAEIDAWLESRKKSVQPEYNIAQVLISVPENASEAVLAERGALAERAWARVRSGEAFEQVAREMSEDSNKARGGEIGMRPANRLPDVFVEKVHGLSNGEVSASLLKSGAGFHLLKLIEKRDGSAVTITQTRARHILLRPSAQLSASAAAARLAGFKREIEAGSRSFEALARENSEDGSAAQGGALGWTQPGSFVPEFEEAMNALPVGGVSDPVQSRFGLHLIQVQERRAIALDAKQMREQARNVLREQKFEEAYTEWAKELRARAYIEMREPPL